MSILAHTLRTRRSEGRKGLIIYVTAGYPDTETTVAAVLAAVSAGADIIEIGIPFSDPIADGPVIQRAAALALKAGSTTVKTLDIIREVRRQSDIPLAVMTYVNTILSYGTEAFMEACHTAGVNGIIVPDLPCEEAELIRNSCKRNELDVIQFIAPTSTPQRIEAICQEAGGFLYGISTTGVTGIRSLDYKPIAASIQVARKVTDVPIAIGFGIGNPQAAREASLYADAVIVGSAVIEGLTNGGVETVRELVSSIRQELDRGSD